MSVIFFIQTFSHIFFLKNTKGVFINHVDTCAKLFHCPNAFYRIEVDLINRIAHSARPLIMWIQKSTNRHCPCRKFWRHVWELFCIFQSNLFRCSSIRVRTDAKPKKKPINFMRIIYKIFQLILVNDLAYFKINLRLFVQNKKVQIYFSNFELSIQHKFQFLHNRSLWVKPFPWYCKKKLIN